MEIMLILIMCILWGIYAGLMQKRVHKSSSAKCVLIGVINAIFAPIAMVFAIYGNIKND